MTDPFNVSKKRVKEYGDLGKYSYYVDGKGQLNRYGSPEKRMGRMLRDQKKAHPEAHKKSVENLKAHGFKVSRFRQRVQRPPGDGWTPSTELATVDEARAGGISKRGQRVARYVTRIADDATRAASNNAARASAETAANFEGAANRVANGLLWKVPAAAGGAGVAAGGGGYLGYKGGKKLEAKGHEGAQKVRAQMLARQKQRKAIAANRNQLQLESGVGKSVLAPKPETPMAEKRPSPLTLRRMKQPKARPTFGQPRTAGLTGDQVNQRMTTNWL